MANAGSNWIATALLEVSHCIDILHDISSMRISFTSYCTGIKWLRERYPQQALPLLLEELLGGKDR